MCGDLQILVAKLDLVYLVKLGHDLDGCERGLTSACCVEGGNAHQTVNAVLCLEEAVGIESFYHDGGALNARAVAVQPVDELDLVVAALCPTGDHAVKHLCPVLCLGSARAGVEGNDGIVFVVFAGEEHLNALFLNGGGNLTKLVLNLVHTALVVFLDCHFGENDGILKPRAECVVIGYRVLCLLDGLENLGGVILFAPEIGSQSLFLKLGHSHALFFNAKRRAKLLDILSEFC